MSRTNEAGVILGLGMLLFAPLAILAQASERTPVVTTPHFALYSDFDANLNDALIAAGVARKGGKPELFHTGAEAACLDKLPPSARAAWDGTVGYYAEIISPAGWTDRQQYLVRLQLAGFDDELKGAEARQFVEIARSFRSAATPAYNACRWGAQDVKNRRWIEDLRSRLAADEQRIAPRLEQLYGKRWGGLPIPVDVVETVDWSGANSILRAPAGGHLLISNSYQGPAALEVIFHEASHLLMGRGDPLRQALESAAGAVGFPLPGELWHVVLFYTTGEALRQILDDGGKPGYRPMLYGIFDRGTWGGYRKALEGAWRPYVDGERTLSEASARLIEALRKPGESQPGDGQPNHATTGAPRHAASTQDYPSRAVRLIEPFGAGGGPDLMARALARKLSEFWGWPVTVENITGAGATAGPALVAKSPADGHTLLVNTSAQAYGAALLTNLPYDPTKGFIPVAPLTRQPYVLVAGKPAGVTTLGALIAAAKVKPGELKFGSTGIGTGTHLGLEEFNLEAGIRAVHVLPRPADAIADIIAGTVTGRTTYMMAPIPLALQYIRDGRLLALGVSGPRRSSLLPEVPTIAEAGVAGFDFPIWYGVWAPAGTPAHVVDALSNEIARALAAPDLRDWLAKHGGEPMNMTQPEFTRFVMSESEVAARIIKAAGTREGENP